jgi:hypothetical protein
MNNKGHYIRQFLKISDKLFHSLRKRFDTKMMFFKFIEWNTYSFDAFGLDAIDMQRVFGKMVWTLLYI